MKAKKRKDVGCPNTQLRMHLCLTPKQLDAIILSLRSSAGIRATEKERAYLRKVIAQIERKAS